MQVPTTKQVRKIVRQTAAELGIEFTRRYDRNLNGEIHTYTDKTSHHYETERMVVFHVPSSCQVKFAHEVAQRMIKQNLQPNFISSQMGYIRILAAIS